MLIFPYLTHLCFFRRLLMSSQLTSTAGCCNPATPKKRSASVRPSVKHCRCDKILSVLCFSVPCSSAVNILSCWYARRLSMWDLILPVLLRRLSFMSLHLFMVTSSWTNESCAISILNRTAGMDTLDFSRVWHVCMYLSAQQLHKELKLFPIKSSTFLNLYEVRKAVGHKMFCHRNELFYTINS